MISLKTQRLSSPCVHFLTPGRSPRGRGTNWVLILIRDPPLPPRFQRNVFHKIRTQAPQCATHKIANVLGKGNLLICTPTGCIV